MYLKAMTNTTMWFWILLNKKESFGIVTAFHKQYSKKCNEMMSPPRSFEIRSFLSTIWLANRNPKQIR